jgi:membrane glycosyltransferase
VGLVVSVPLAMMLASVPLGEYLAKKGLLLIPEETATPDILKLQKLAAEKLEAEASLLERSSLFNSVLLDPSFYSLHKSILHATDSNVPVKETDLKEIVNLISRDGTIGLSKEARKKVLSNADAMKEIHIYLRSRQRFKQSYLKS